MPILMTQRSTILVTVLSMSLMVASCSEKIEDSAAYQAACQGPPLRTVELRNMAMEDGYDINRQYNCIDKASFVAENERRAKWEAANTPEAIARRMAEFADLRARDVQQQARKATAEDTQTKEALPNIVLRDIDVNTATEEEIASVISISSATVAQIIEERNKRRFNDWADLVQRVIGLSAAQTAVYASICGLNVDGKSLEGAPPNAEIAASIYQKYQQHQKN